MNMQRLSFAYYHLTSGWGGFLVFYALIAAFSLAGLKCGRGGFMNLHDLTQSTFRTLKVAATRFD
jgi:hypothetical protein